MMTAWFEPSRLSVEVKTSEQRPPEFDRTLEEFWLEAIRDKPYLFRGPVLAVERIVLNADGSVRVICYFTDYAHHLYSHAYLSAGDPLHVRVIFAAGCLTTLDGFLIAGIMGEHSTRPGWIQAIGGAATEDDMSEEYFDPERSVIREMGEEVGIFMNDDRRIAVTKQGFTMDGNGSIAVAVRVALPWDVERTLETIRLFLDHQRQAGGHPELSDVVALPFGEAGIERLSQLQLPTVRYLKKILVAGLRP